MNNTSGMRTSRFNTPKIKGVFKKLFYVLCATLLVAITVNVFKRLNTKSADAKIELKSATSTTNIDRELSFPLKNANGEEVSSFAYTLEKAELRDEIIVEGKRATAIAGRTFLIINIKLVNNYDSAIQINSKDYVRLSVNGNKDEWLAPDIHNDPIEVQAISTKLSRIGFPIDDTATDLVLRVGEVRGEKEEIPLSF